MGTIDLSARHLDVAALLRLAEKEPILLTNAGQEFMVSKEDDFDAEVEALRRSARFQAFLNKRRKDSTWIPMAQVEKEIAAELAKRRRK